MTDTKKHPVALPRYSLGEELISSISHGVGAALAVAALVLCIVTGAMHRDPWAVVSGSVYGATLIILYTMSTLYHAFPLGRAKRVFRVIDHCSVFLLIAGTYTPFTLVTLRGPVGWVLFGVVWGAAALGIVMSAIDLQRFRIASMVSYLAAGWVIIFAFRPLLQAMQTPGIVLLLTGGVAYTVGAGIYLVGKKVKYMHSLWHFFVLAGSILHFFSILLYVL